MYYDSTLGARDTGLYRTCPFFSPSRSGQSTKVERTHGLKMVEGGHDQNLAMQGK